MRRRTGIRVCVDGIVLIALCPRCMTERRQMRLPRVSDGAHLPSDVSNGLVARVIGRLRIEAAALAARKVRSSLVFPSLARRYAPLQALDRPTTPARIERVRLSTPPLMTAPVLATVGRGEAAPQ